MHKASPSPQKTPPAEVSAQPHASVEEQITNQAAEPQTEPIAEQTANPATDSYEEPTSAQLPPVPGASPRRWPVNVDLLALIMVTVLVINLAVYLHCMHVNLSHIEERDHRHAPAPAQNNDPNDSGRAERERIERGEAEQQLHDPNRHPEAPAAAEDQTPQPALASSNIETPEDQPNSASAKTEPPEAQPNSAGTSASSQKAAATPAAGNHLAVKKHPVAPPRPTAAPPGMPNSKFDLHWLSVVLRSRSGRLALESLARRTDSLKLTPKQVSVLLENKKSDKQPKLNSLVQSAIDTLHSKQLEYLISQRSSIDRQSLQPLSTSMLIDNTCEQLSVIKLSHPQITGPEIQDKKTWNPRQLALGISLLTNMPDEEYRLDADQAQKLQNYLQKIGELDKEIQQESCAPLPIEGLLSEEQMHYLFEELRNNER